MLVHIARVQPDSFPCQCVPCWATSHVSSPTPSLASVCHAGPHRTCPARLLPLPVCAMLGHIARVQPDSFPCQCVPCWSTSHVSSPTPSLASVCHAGPHR